MSGDREPTRGSVAVETALLLPFLILLVVGGWVLGYLVYTKVALAMVANRAARDLAANTELYGQFAKTNQPYRYDGGFAESFGLPRWGLHAVAMKAPIGTASKKESDHGVMVAVCYRVPFTVPFGVMDRPQPPVLDTKVAQDLVLDTADIAEGIGADDIGQKLREAESEFRRQKALLEEEVAAWDRLLQDAKGAYDQAGDLWKKGGWLIEKLKQLFGKEVPDFQPFGKDGKSVKLEEVVKTLCDPPERLKDESIVLTSRATYLMQPVFTPSQAGGLKLPKQKGGAKK